MYCHRKSNNLINSIHERALRIAYNDYTSNFNILLKKDDSVSIHERNNQALAWEIFKTMKNLNPPFMNDIFCPLPKKYNLRNETLKYRQPKTVTHGLETFGYKASHIYMEHFTE